MTSSVTLAGTIPQAFNEQVRRTPERCAIVAKENRLTYKELDVLSNHIAAELTRQGFGRNNIGAVLLDRSIYLVAGVLGILKTGGAYLPLDPEYPEHRLQKILHASAPTVLLSTASVRAGVAAGRWSPIGPSVVEVDALFAGRGTGPNEPDGGVLRQALQPNDLAYVVYTSGSTGEPKGAMNEHKSVLNLVEALHHTILAPYDALLNVALVASLVFDVSVQQIFSTLLLGHTLFVVPEEARRDPWKLVEFYRRNEIHVTDGTPAHLEMLCHVRGDDKRPLPVRHFIIGGEVLSPEVVTEFRAQWCQRGARITNIYGVAECCVDSLSYLTDPAEIARLGFVPIGTVLPNVEIHVLDQALEPVQPGEVGELCIGGVSVGRGYLNDDDLTAARFVRCPSQPDRIYRTGDLARQLPDGKIQYVGRADRQVKLRGYRIEPEEIEAAFLRYQDGSDSGAAGVEVKSVVTRCERCLLESTHPGVTIEAGVCSVCRTYDRYRDTISAYFRSRQELIELIKGAASQRSGDADCLLLFSGGKDSTYVLYQLIEWGLRVLTFTFDNGFISDAAFDNIRRITTQLGVEHITSSVLAMPAIFVESLQTESTVCSGCFRGLTAASTRLAQERGINVVVTGLSRGQIVETKLKPLLQAGISDAQEIDRRLLTHRKLYHARADRTAQLLNVPLAPESLNEMFFVDYFRYDPAPTSQVRAYLARRDSFWSEPKDTGLCSTNCRINDVGIYVHQLQRGFHNYTAPLSWDCRLGVLPRDEGLRELEGVVNEEAVRGILQQINYQPRVPVRVIRNAAVVLQEQAGREPWLCAYYVSDRFVDIDELWAHLQRELPRYMVPSQYLQLDAMPVTVNGKTDYATLADVSGATDGWSTSPQREASATVPLTPTEESLLQLWAETLELVDVDVEDDFFALGGNSLTATVLVGLITEEFGVRLPVTEAFERPTVRDIAKLIDARQPTSEWQAKAGQNAILLAPGGSESPMLFLCHDVMGGVDSYISLAQRLSPSYATFGIAATAEQTLAEQNLTEQSLQSSIEDLCRSYMGRLRQVQPHGPYVLGGWSFGGILALELALQIELCGDAVELLVVMDSDAPVQQYWTQLHDRAFASLAGLLGESVQHRRSGWNRSRLWQEVEQRVIIDRLLSFSDIMKRLPDKLLDGVLEHLGVSESESFASLWRVLVLVEALAAYTPIRKVRCPVLYIEARGSRRPRFQTEHWQRLTAGRFSYIQVDGDHVSMMREPHITEVALAIKDCAVDVSR